MSGLRYQPERAAHGWGDILLSEVETEASTHFPSSGAMPARLDSVTWCPFQILPSAQLGGETSQTNQPNPKAAADSAVPGEQGEEGRRRVFSTGSVNRLHLES